MKERVTFSLERESRTGLSLEKLKARRGVIRCICYDKRKRQENASIRGQHRNEADKSQRIAGTSPAVPFGSSRKEKGIAPNSTGRVGEILMDGQQTPSRRGGGTFNYWRGSLK